MTEKELKEIRERCEKATEGPWELGGIRPGIVTSKLNAQENLDICDLAIANYLSPEAIENNVEFIAHARTDIPKLLDEIERLKELLKYSEMFRTAYRKGKIGLYACGGEILEAAMKHLPCSEGPLERASARAVGERMGWVSHEIYEKIREQNDKFRKALQKGLDFYNLPTEQWCNKYGSGMSTRELAEEFRKALGEK